MGVYENRHLKGNYRHGHGRNGNKTPTYRSWNAMLCRCTHPTNKMYHAYGGRGITVCERWMTFANFLADMGERPAGLTLDRINNDGNYEPDNCKWATRSEQNSNTRRSLKNRKEQQ